MGIEKFDEPSVWCPQRLHLHFDPPEIQVHQGFTYARHSLHLGGPESPNVTTGTGSSPDGTSAKGCMIAAMGIWHVSASEEEKGICHVVARTKRGEELP